MSTPVVVHIVGYKNSGKTRLMGLLVGAFARLGLKAGTIKHDGCDHFRWDREGTDTHRFRQAGSPTAAILSGTAFAVESSTGLDVSLADLSRLFFRDVDVLLVEGFKRMKGIKVEVVRRGYSPEPACDPEELAASFGDELFPREVPHFPADGVDDLARLLARRAGH